VLPVRIALLVVLAGCGSTAATTQPESDTDPELIGDDPGPEPSVRASLSFDEPSALLSTGNVDLSARPEHHEFRVHLMVGAARVERRWAGCRKLELRLDGRTIAADSVDASSDLSNGVYDAVGADFTIAEVRSIAAAREAVLDVCGTAIPLHASDRSSLDGFIRAFDAMATYDGPAPPPPPVYLDEAGPRIRDESLAPDYPV
jgi:hypothetical protein